MSPIRLAGASPEQRLELGRKVKSARVDAGLTQTELAEAANVHRRTISNMENGIYAPQEDVLRKVYVVLGIPTNDDAPDHDVEQYLGMIGAMLGQIPKGRRLVVVNRITAMLMSEAVSNVGGADEAVVTPFAAGDDDTHEQLDPDTV